MVEKLEESDFAEGCDGELSEGQLAYDVLSRTMATAYAVLFVMHNDFLERVDGACSSRLGAVHLTVPC